MGGGGLHGSLPWALGVVEEEEEEEVGSRNQRERDAPASLPPLPPLHRQAPIVSLIWDWEEKVENCGGGGWRSGPTPPPAPTLSNLYPPLTPVPQCVAEIRASGQSPHSLPPKNILKLSPPFA